MKILNFNLQLKFKNKSNFNNKSNYIKLNYKIFKVVMEA